MGYDIYDSYRDEWPTELGTLTGTDDWRYYNQHLKDLSIAIDKWASTSGWSVTNNLIATFIDKLNVEWQCNKDELELDITFDEFMGFEKSEDE